jgi:hypothetical protein
MKRKLLGAALALMMTGSAHAFTQAECEKRWPEESHDDFTCVHLTEQFWVGLQGATKEQVVKMMKTEGQPGFRAGIDNRIGRSEIAPSGDPRFDTLHFLSIPDGGISFTFENDRATIIFGWTDDGQFIWNQANQFACSDLPGGHYARCNK